MRLGQSTRDGDDTLYLLCTLPEAAATATQVAELYHRRWSIEAAFLSLTKELRCEVDTLAQPGAALFAFACASVAYNLIAIIGAALRAAHGHEVEASLSRFHLGHELERVRDGLEVAVEPEAWAVFATLSLAVMATWLLQTAAKADLRRYKMANRGPKKPPVKRHNDPAHSTVSEVDPLSWTPKLFEPLEEATMKTRPPYAAEFRQQMIGLVRSGKTPEQLAEEFEPTAQTIRNGMAQAGRDAGTRSDGATSAEREELRRLRLENRRLRSERDILAKAAAWFARETGTVPGESSDS